MLRFASSHILSFTGSLLVVDSASGNVKGQPVLGVVVPLCKRSIHAILLASQAGKATPRELADQWEVQENL